MMPDWWGSSLFCSTSTSKLRKKKGFCNRWPLTHTHTHTHTTNTHSHALNLHTHPHEKSQLSSRGKVGPTIFSRFCSLFNFCLSVLSLCVSFY